MQLKSYQQSVINDLHRYLQCFRATNHYKKAYEKYWLEHEDFPQVSSYKDTLVSSPHICVKVPTAGGKTFIACNAIKTLFDNLEITHTQAVVWLVPSDAILDQTYKNLSNPQHPYRAKLNQLFNRKVEVYTKSQLLDGAGFSLTSTQENLSIFVLSYQAIRADKQTKDRRTIYQQNGKLLSFFTTNDRSFCLQAENVDEISLINVIRKLRPVCIIDEAHKAITPLSIEMLNNINPRFVLELTATPRKDKKGNPLSNIISYIDSAALKSEGMVKLPVLVYNLKNTEEVLNTAIDLQKSLEQKAKNVKEYIRPIVLCQAQSKKGDEERDTFDKIQALLIEKGIPENHIKIKTSDNKYKNSLKDDDLMSANSETRYIITIDALNEGWDCPFAYILATVANKTSPVAIEQIVGRILRKPYTKEYNEKLLNMSYVLTSSNQFQSVLQQIVEALNHQGFSKEDSQVLEYVKEEIDFVLENPDNKSKSPDYKSLKDFCSLNDSVKEEIDFVLEKPDNKSKSPDYKSLKDFCSLNESPNNYSFSSDSTQSFAEDAENIYTNDQKNRETAQKQGNTIIPNDLQDKVTSYAMKPQYKAIAEAIVMPQFFVKVPPNPLTNFQKTEVLLNKSLLLANFDLSKQGIDIKFDSLEIDLYEIDLEQQNDNQTSFAYAKATDKMQKLLLENIAKQSTEGQQKSLTNLLVQRMGKMYPFEEKDLQNYVLKIVQTWSQERFNEALQKSTNYASLIQKYIHNLASNYAIIEFKTWKDTKKLFVLPSYKLPSTITPPKTYIPVRNSLYEREPEMNGTEAFFVANIANLPNVVFWHKFENKGKQNFIINGGFCNHFPDFLIVTQKNQKILVEIKGNHLDGEETKQKIELGNVWENMAGEDYSYFLVFETLQVEGTYDLQNIKEIIAKL